MAAKFKNFEMFPTLEELNQARKLQESCLNMIMQNDNCDKKYNNCESISFESSNSSVCSFSSSDLIEDATSSSSSSSNGPLFKLSDLMDNLPIKRGLSKYYQGKSQSFTSLASVESLEDLAKRENPYNKRIKLCRSYCGGFDKTICSPKPKILKKSSSKCFSTRRICSNNLMASCKPPTIPSVQNHF